MRIEQHRKKKDVKEERSQKKKKKSLFFASFVIACAVPTRVSKGEGKKDGCAHIIYSRFYSHTKRLFQHDYIFSSLSFFSLYIIPLMSVCVCVDEI
jgi:hypothetical protein